MFPISDDIVPFRWLSYRSISWRERDNHSFFGMAPTRLLMLRLSLLIFGKVAKSKASSWPLSPAPGRLSSTIWPAASHATPYHEQQVELPAGDHDDRELATAKEAFHWRSASSCGLLVALAMETRKTVVAQKRILACITCLRSDCITAVLRS
ncbi:hypothetical protein PVAP13_9KG103120 [Panicum virgatum]|uniref:Uncharacterized protein n=1 Tax=Panicum virgatum TaxID=38727 RepID=A0A8T0NF20_PANVG|nr:hypothetical protein PVAP13_9KG103120 [Panicum virgatum]